MDTTKKCERCDTVFGVGTGKAEQAKRFCSKSCSNKATAQRRADALRSGPNGYKPNLCPCGEYVEPLESKTYNYTKKYCSTEHRWQYGPAGGPKKDPAKYKTFNCLTCHKEVTRYKKYGNGHNKYCSNACAQKLTKVKHHIVLRDDDVVLDSSWECAFWGIARVAKLPIERFDRSLAIEWKPDQFYAPDFWMPSVQWRTDRIGAAIEIKGHEDPDDQLKWAAFRATGTDLIIIDTYRMEHLSAHNFADTLRIACGRDNPSI